MRVSSFENVPPINPEDVFAKHRLWHQGETVTSEFYSVGIFEPTAEEVALVGLAGRYSYLAQESAQDPLYEGTLDLRGRYTDFLEEEIERDGLHGELHVEVKGGRYSPVDYDPWHSDMAHRAFVRWTWAVGRGPTRGAVGQTSIHDVIARNSSPYKGNLRDQSIVSAAPTSRLQPVVPPVHSVNRIYGAGDIHAGSQVFKPGFLLRGTLYLKP